MQPYRWHWLGIGLVALGVLIGWVSMVAGGGPWGIAEWGVLIGGIVALAGLFWFRRRLSEAAVDLEARQAELDASKTQLQELRAALAAQAESLDDRQRDLMQRLAVWHEWMEFPEPVDLSQQGEAAAIEQGERLRSLSTKDRQLNQLLEQESKLLFDNILRNKYTVGGQFQPTLIRDDALVLIKKVAQIYRPNIEHPLAETSLEQLARATSRACLHFLVVLDTLPVKVQQYNMKKMYGWITQGVKAYGVYRSAQPYLPYVNSAYYLTRFAMGANPISLLAWWAASEVASRTATSVTRRVVQQKSLALLHDVVRVIGFEVAGLYGGQLRHRDANWIYGVELTEMLSQFPLARDSLAAALTETGTIQLLNEYDRIFLYRCIAAHKSAGPQQYPGVDNLSGALCHAVARRLEHFFAQHIHGKTDKRVASWREEVEQRLGVKMKLDVHAPALSAGEQAREAMLSLASFLLVVKQIPPDELGHWLQECQTYAALAEDDPATLLAKCRSEPPAFFAEPNLDPDGELTEKYLRDLAMLAAFCPPLDVPLEELLADVGAYLRRERAEVERLLERQFQEAVRQRMAPQSKTVSVPPQVARAVLWLLEPGERVRFVYEGAARRAADGGGKRRHQTWWLLGTDQRLLVFSAGEVPAVVWMADTDAQLQPDIGRWVNGCSLQGGIWMEDPQSRDAVYVPGQPLRRFESYFAPLLAVSGQQSAVSNKPTAKS